MSLARAAAFGFWTQGNSPGSVLIGDVFPAVKTRPRDFLACDDPLPMAAVLAGRE